MNPIPQTIGLDLFNQLNSVSRNDEMAIRRIEREAKKLKNVDTIAYLIVISGVFSLKGDASNVLDTVRKLRKIAPTNKFVWLNSSVSLFRTGLLQESAGVALEGAKRCAIDSELFDKSLILAPFLENQEYFSQLVDLYRNSGQAIELDEALEMISFIDQFPKNQPGLTDIVQAAEKLLSEFDGGSMKSRASFVDNTFYAEPDGKKHLYSCIFIDEEDEDDEERVYALHDAFIEEMASEKYIDNEAMDLFTLDFVLHDKEST